MNRWQKVFSAVLEGFLVILSHDFRWRSHTILPGGKESSEFRGTQQLHSSHAAGLVTYQREVQEQTSQQNTKHQ